MAQFLADLVFLDHGDKGGVGLGAGPDKGADPGMGRRSRQVMQRPHGVQPAIARQKAIAHSLPARAFQFEHLDRQPQPVGRDRQAQFRHLALVHDHAVADHRALVDLLQRQFHDQQPLPFRLAQPFRIRLVARPRGPRIGGFHRSPRGRIGGNLGDGRDARPDRRPAMGFAAKLCLDPGQVVGAGGFQAPALNHWPSPARLAPSEDRATRRPGSVP